MPEYLRADASALSLIKLLFSTTLSFLQFPPRHFVPYLSFRSFLLFYHKKLKILAFFMQLFLLANVMMPFFCQHRNPLNFVSNTFFITSYVMLIASTKSRTARGASHHPIYMASCLIISHTCLPCLRSEEMLF